MSTTYGPVQPDAPKTPEAALAGYVSTLNPELELSFDAGTLLEVGPGHGKVAFASRIGEAPTVVAIAETLGDSWAITSVTACQGIMAKLGGWSEPPS